MAASSRRSAPIIPASPAHALWHLAAARDLLDHALHHLKLLEQAVDTPAEIKIDADRAREWIKTGAQPTETVRALLKKVDVL